MGDDGGLDNVGVSSEEVPVPVRSGDQGVQSSEVPLPQRQGKQGGTEAGSRVLPCLEIMVRLALLSQSLRVQVV